MSNLPNESTDIKHVTEMYKVCCEAMWEQWLLVVVEGTAGRPAHPSSPPVPFTSQVEERGEHP